MVDLRTLLRSPQELAVRGRQALAAWADRRGWSDRVRPAELKDLLQPELIGASAGKDLLARFRARSGAGFFPAFGDRAALAATWRGRFGDAALAELVARAKELQSGRFRLLGYTNLFFGDPIDWHLEPLSGRRAPRRHWTRIDYLDERSVGDKKVVWELNRHQHFALLGRAYLLTGDERYVRTWKNQVESWMAANPPGFGIAWASSLEVAFRAISWIWALHLCQDSANISPDFFVRVVQCLHAHARHIETYLSTYFSPNTHLTGEALGLFYLGTQLPELRGAARWRELGADILLRELDRHVLSDGVYFEQSTYYHRYTAEFYTHFHILRQASGAPPAPRLTERLTALLDFLLHVTRPDGTLPLLGDDDGGQLVRLDDRAGDDGRALLCTGACLFQREDYRAQAGDFAEETLWLLGSEAAATFDELGNGIAPGASRAFPAGGFYIMRDGTPPRGGYLIIDGGPHGALSGAHAHADALSFELAVGGAPVIVDPGTYTYTGNATDRNTFRSSAFHNTVSIDGQSSAVPRGPFSWAQMAETQVLDWSSTERYDYFVAQHDGYGRLEPALRHQRTVLFLKDDYWIVRDRIGPMRETHRCELNLHFSPHCQVRSTGHTARVSFETMDGTRVLDLLSFPAELAWEQCSQFVSRCYGARTSAPVLRAGCDASGTADLCTVLVPASATSRAPEATDLSTDQGLLIALSGGGAGDGRDLVLLATGESVEVGPLRTDASCAWVRMRDQVVTEVVMIHGSYLELSGTMLVSRPQRGDVHATTPFPTGIEDPCVASTAL